MDYCVLPCPWLQRHLLELLSSHLQNRDASWADLLVTTPHPPHGTGGECLILSDLRSSMLWGWQWTGGTWCFSQCTLGKCQRYFLLRLDGGHTVAFFGFPIIYDRLTPVTFTMPPQFEPNKIQFHIWGAPQERRWHKCLRLPRSAPTQVGVDINLSPSLSAQSLHLAKKLARDKKTQAQQKHCIFWINI